MAEFDVEMVDMARNESGEYVITPKLLALLADGKEPRTGALAYLHALAEECKRHRATMTRISEFALSLEHGHSPDQRAIGAELRNRIKGG